MDYIGYLISFLAMIYLFFKQQSAARYPQENSDGFSPEEVEEDESLTKFIKTIGVEEKKRSAVKQAPPLPPKQAKPMRKGAASPLEQYRLESAVEKRQLKSPLASRQLKPSVKKPMEEPAPKALPPPLYPSDTILHEPSRAQEALGRLAHRRELLIYQEIIDKPKSMRPFL